MGRKKKEVKDWKDMPDSYERYKTYMKSDDWAEVRQKILDHYNHHCVCCGRNEDETTLAIHHAKYDGVLYDELNHMDYVVPLCKNGCHRAIHSFRPNWQRFRQSPQKFKKETIKKDPNPKKK